jgi:7-cyano-7-deazaguanine reductase
VNESTLNASSVKDTLLGQHTEYPVRYAPEVLCPVPRQEGRSALGLASGLLPFQGVDVWTHYEVSWLDAAGKPVVALAELVVPADSPNLIESKSLKLYFNSLNFERFSSEADFSARVEADLGRVAGAPVALRLWLAGHAEMPGIDRLPGVCLDDLPLSCEDFVLDAAHLRADPTHTVAEVLNTNLLRSLCPVTHQPDWGSVLIRYKGPAIDRAGLLAYVVSFRNHPDFHEQCVERIFMDILTRCQPEMLTVYARYTRRGGLDINPFRTNCGDEPSPVRLFRQ